MTSERIMRVKCPDCDRRTAQLARKDAEGRYKGYVRDDGSAIYSCAWENCTVGDFTVLRTGAIVSITRKKVNP